MRMKRYLIIGDPHSFWNKNFITNMLQPYGYQIDIFYTYLGMDRQDNFYQGKNIHIYSCPKALVRKKENGSLSSKIHTMLCILYCMMWSIKNRDKYDIVNVQFVDWIAILCARYLNGKKSKLILSYWGSDLLRKSARELRYTLKGVKRADQITFDNLDLKHKFRQTFGAGFDHKLNVAMFGLPILDKIEENKKTRSRNVICKEINLNPEKLVVAVGYAARPDQQHIKVLEQIAKLSQHYKDKIQIVLQLTYPVNKSYTDQLEDYVKKIGCESKLILREMTDSEVADLRIINDIFINAQCTDAFSGTVCENLFSNTLLLNAKWLRYAEFEEHPFKFVEFQNFEEIPDLLGNMIDKYSNTKSGNNERLVWNLRSWEKCRGNWTDIFKDLDI